MSTGTTVITRSFILLATIALGLLSLMSQALWAEEVFAEASDIQDLLSARRYREALPTLERMADAAGRAGDAAGEARVAHDLGVAHLGLGESDEALGHLETAASLAEKAGMPVLAASALNNLGTAHAGQPGGELLAREAYRRAALLAETEGRLDLVFDALTNEARFELDQGQKADAISLLEQADAQLTTTGDDAQTTKKILLLGRLFSRAGAIEEGYAALSEARERARSHAQSREEALATGYLADVYAEADRDGDATQLYTEATFLAQAAEAPELIYQWQWRIGRLTADAGDIDGAIAHYQGALSELDKLRPTLIETPTAGSGTIDLRTAYVELADLMLQRAAGSPSEEARLRDLEAARQTIERYRTTELTDYFQDECVTDLLASVKPIDRLEPRTAVLYPIVMAERLVILLSLPEGLQQRSLPIGADDLTEKILEFRTLLEKRTTNEFLRPAQEIYDLLLRPLEPTLKTARIDTLVIVPDAALRTIPLGALHDGQEFVVDRYALATVPSLRLIKPKPLARMGLQPLLGGLSDSVQDFPALPHVDSELRNIEGLIGGDVLRNNNFVVDQIEQSLGATPHSVVHIASHARFAGDAKNSFILTYDGRIDMDSLEGFIKLSRFRDQPVELLTLSACQTAAGDDRAALGLAGLAVKSGARSAVASLWYVNDRASSLLLADFYQQLRDLPLTSKAKALQQAQIATKTDLRYRHPAFWAPMILIGNWL